MFFHPTGTLNIFFGQTTNGAYASDLKWSLSGQQQGVWGEATIPLKGYTAPYTVVYEAVPDDGDQGNIAVDDIEFYGLDCSLAPVAADPGSSNPTPAPTQGPIPAGPINCDFDSGFCDFTQVTLLLTVIKKYSIL